MSKPQPQTRATQQRNILKESAGITSKRTASSNPTKAPTSSSKVHTQLKTATGSSLKVTNPTLEEKLKRKSTIPTRVTEPPTVTKSRTPRDVVKAQNKLVTKPTANTSRNIPKASINRNAPTTKAQIAATPRKSGISEQPVRAKHNLKITGEIKKRPPTAVKPNAVLDTYHNVTVASPPPTRKEITPEPLGDNVVRNESDEPPKRVRTHSLEEEDIIVLRSDSAKRRIEQQILTHETPHNSTSSHETNIFDVDANELLTQRRVVKEPVAFEVSLDEPLKSKSKAKSRDASAARKSESRGQAVAEPDADSYSDDFESYESDFETGSSAQNDTETDVSPSSAGSEDEGKSKSTGSLSSEEEEPKGVDMTSEDEEESELTQNPVTVIQRERDIERKLDSGNYEMNSRKHPKLAEITAQMSERTFDSMETAYSVATSDQLDSGISTYATTHSTQGDVDKFGGIVCAYGGYAAFNTHPILSKRGKELMRKIQFDTLTFSLFELKPISYEVYMQTYGTLNTTQCSTQTNDERMTSESQTDAYEMRTIWTQHPPQYDLQTVQRLGGGLNGATALQNCCGEVPLEESNTMRALNTDLYDGSLQQLATFRQSNKNRILDQQLRRLHKSVDFERLNSFMLRASYLVLKVLNSAQDLKQEKSLNKLTQSQHSLHEISAGFVQLETQLLSALHVVRIFASAKHDLIITVHASPPDADVYRSDFSNLLMVWSTSDTSKPLRLLSTWSEVCRAEICYDCADIVVCGLRDGSIAMWDLRETYSYCSKLDGYLTHFAATQSVVPTWGGGKSDETHRLVDLGAVVDVRSFRKPVKAINLGAYRSIQFAALNDSGILSMWTLVETSVKHYEFDTKKSSNTHRQSKRSSAHTPSARFEYSSPWARVKLIQSALCDLREYLERGLRRAQTQFEKTKLIFQKEIYNDEALRELNNSNALQHQTQQLQGLRFTGIDTGCERIYVCTNRNFVLTCSKSLKSDRFRKININEDCLLFPTALRVLSNENFLAVGLSNGSVMIVNCNQQKLPHQRNGGASRLDTARSNDDGARHAIGTPRTSPDIDPDTGKSCAIQNIILNERRLLTGSSTLVDEYDTRPTTAACIALIGNEKRPFEIRVYDQQLILSGSALRKDLVQSLELSSDGWRLFALVNGRVRTYDFYLDCEIAEEMFDAHEKRVMDLAVAKNSQSENNLIVLGEGNIVEVHLLKQ